MTEPTPNWAVTWVDSFAAPAIEPTDEALAADVFPTFRAAKAYALSVAVDQRERAAGLVRAVRAMRKDES